MKFRNYCVVIMGNTKDAYKCVAKIAENQPNIVDAKGVFIATFSSFAEPVELSNYFKSYTLNFMVFDLDTENSGYNFINPEINNGLFGFLKNMDKDFMNEKTNALIKEISGATIEKSTKVISLEEQLSKAVEDENYDLAVILRDKINKK
jgi:hypothetical protein